MRPALDDLRERLLLAGIKPGLARRYVGELADHFEDLLETETPEAAMRRLGSADALADAMLAQPGVRSWTARAPWATLTLGPLLALLAGCLLPAFLLFLAVRAFAADLDYGHAAYPGTWPHAVLGLFSSFDERLLPVLVGWAAVALALRQRAGLGWLLAGAALLAVLGGGLFLQVDWHAGHPASVGFWFGYKLEPMFTTHWGRSPETCLFNLVAILAPYGVWKLRKSESA